MENGVDYDVAIVGGGPAGLSAAITLGRARRSVIVYDHGRPRNYAAQAVHCYLGIDGLPPAELRNRGRDEARKYGIIFDDTEVLRLSQQPLSHPGSTGFQLQTATKQVGVRAVVLATGMIDELPDIPGIKDFYGRSVHHCPYCDGWEHRDKQLVALGKASAATSLALTLRGWTNRVTACTNGQAFDDEQRALLERHGISAHEESISCLLGKSGALARICFIGGSELLCDALFFSSEQAQRSLLPEMLGCAVDDEGLFVTGKKHCSNVDNAYLVGDADGDVQFAIVAAAEGAIAATAIDQALRRQDTTNAVPLMELTSALL